MTFSGPVNRMTLTEQIADSIEASILAEDLYHKKLPSEQALSEQFGVSRTIVREALKLLSARGLVKSRIGGGSYVTKPSASDISQLLVRVIKMDKISDYDVYQMRLLLELASVKALAPIITDEQLQQLGEQVNSMEEHMYDLPVRMEKDIEFHTMIGKMCGNKLFAVMIESMIDVLRDFIAKGIKAAGGNEDGIHRHRIILEALATRNPDIAVKAMQDHLEHSYENIKTQEKDLSNNPE